MYAGTWSTHNSCQILIELEFSQQILKKSSTIKFHGNPSSSSGNVPCRQTYSQSISHDEARPIRDLMKLCHFSQSCEHAKKWVKTKGQTQNSNIHKLWDFIYLYTNSRKGKQSEWMSIPVLPFPQPAWINLEEEIYSSFTLSLPVKLLDRWSIVN